ncbi:MAG: hypothetical protein ABI718_08495 [Acidobacteriota bacterium]
MSERDDMDDVDDAQDESDEQIEQMIVENGMLVHTLANLLVQKGVLKQEEIEAEMDRLYDAMESFEDADEE